MKKSPFKRVNLFGLFMRTGPGLKITFVRLKTDPISLFLMSGGRALAGDCVIFDSLSLSKPCEQVIVST